MISNFLDPPIAFFVLKFPKYLYRYNSKISNPYKKEKKYMKFKNHTVLLWQRNLIIPAK